MTVNELLGVLSSQDQIMIKHEEEVVYVGYLACMKGKEILDEVGEKEVLKFRMVPEIWHKNYEELGLTKPYQPDETPLLDFIDLNLIIYYTICI